MRLSVCPKVDTLVSDGASERAAPGGIVEGCVRGACFLRGPGLIPSVRGRSLPSGYHNTQFWRPTPLDPRTHPSLFRLSANDLKSETHFSSALARMIHP